MNPLWTGTDMMSAMGARPIGDVPASVKGISIDTRSLTAGDAFFAIRGERFDGHDFIADAMKAGAALAVVSEQKIVALGGMRIPLLVVKDVLEALVQLGIAARARTRAKLIAVTGSVGKTSTKEMLRTGLGGIGPVHASPHSFNNHWGVPLSLARMPAATQFGVFEIGMNHAGEIGPLSRMVRPHVAMITNIAAAHIGSFDGLAGIARAKAEIFEGLVADGAVLLPRDSRQFNLLASLAGEAGITRVLTFGRKRDSHFRLLEADIAEEESTGRLDLDGRRINLRLPVPGEHLLLNALAALAAASLAGADPEIFAERLSRIEAARGRGERHRLRLDSRRIVLIDESYNANPASMEAALRLLGRTEPHGSGRRIAVLGDMRELGASGPKLHRALKKPIAENGTDLVFLAGPEMEVLADELDPALLHGHFADSMELASALPGQLADGDVIVVKASNGMQFSKIVETLLAAGSESQAEVS